jgi:hypothetical protein
VVAAAGVAAAVIPAVADSGNQSNAKGRGANHAQHGGQSIEVQSGLAGGSGGTILAASLNGANEVRSRADPPSATRTARRSSS